MVKNLPANAGIARDTGSTAGSGRSPGGGNSNPFQYSCLDMRRLVEYSPWGCKESDMMEHVCTQVHTYVHTHTHGEELKFERVELMYFFF